MLGSSKSSSSLDYKKGKKSLGNGLLNIIRNLMSEQNEMKGNSRHESMDRNTVEEKRM